MKEADDKLADFEVESATSRWQAVKRVDNQKGSVCADDGSVRIEMLACGNSKRQLLFRLVKDWSAMTDEGLKFVEMATDSSIITFESQDLR